VPPPLQASEGKAFIRKLNKKATQSSDYEELLPIPSSAVALPAGFLLALISALLRRAIPALSFEVIHACFRVHPYHCIIRAMLVRFLLRMKLRCGLGGVLDVEIDRD
jgi:hypothetical protein